MIPMIPTRTHFLLLGCVLVLFGAGCFRGTEVRTASSNLPTVTIPADFPTDILRYPDAQTYAANIQNDIPILGQITTSSTKDVITWINKNYADAKKDLHVFSDQGSTKLYSFQNTNFRYNVRLEIASDSSTTKIVTQRVPLEID